MRAYTTEATPGNTSREIRSNNTGQTERYELIAFTVGGLEISKNWSKAYK
jgi:hypothetical protein